jgi:hypothetical protein
MNMSLSYRNKIRSLAALLALFAIFVGTRPASVIAAVEYNEMVPLHDDFDGCSGERILIDGVQHIVGRFTQDSDGKLHFGFTRNTKGTGIGQISGDTYILTDAVVRSIVEAIPGEPHVFTQQFQSLLIRQGEESSGDDAVIHFLTKIMINANGEMTVSIDIQNVECR